MATGYTWPIESGEDASLRGFALRLEGVGGDWAPTELAPYWRGRLIMAIDRFNEVEGWSEEQADAAAEASYQAQVAHLWEYREKQAAILTRYRDLLAQVGFWEVPALLEPLRSRMIELLEEEIDSNERYDATLTEPIRQSGEEYRLQEIEQAARFVSNRAKDWIRQQEETARHNEYMVALFAALERAG